MPNLRRASSNRPQMPQVWSNESPVNLWDKIKAIPGGAVHVAGWLGEGGRVVGPKDSQERADCCNGDNPTGKRCPNNEPGTQLTGPVADAIKKTLEVKNKLRLRVRGEKMLGTCTACGCVLRLKVHEPIDRVRRQITDEEYQKLPRWCWKIKA